MAFLSSCTHHYYIQNTQNVPLFKEKNEFCGTIAVGGGDEINKFDAQCAYSFTENFAFMGSYMFAENDGNSESEEGGYGYYGDAAFGYFHPLNKYFIFETYAGFGLSEQHHRYSYYSEVDPTLSSSDLSFIKFYLQPSIGLTTNFLDLATSFRLSSLNFTNIDHFPIFVDPTQSYDLKELNDIRKNKDYYLWEPAATIRLGVC